MQSSSSLRRMVLLLVVLVLVLWVGHSQSASVRTTRHYAGSIPMGLDVKDFLQICQRCGEFFGTEYSSSCVHDKTFKTFVICMGSYQGRW